LDGIGRTRLSAVTATRAAFRFNSRTGTAERNFETQSADGTNVAAAHARNSPEGKARVGNNDGQGLRKLVLEQGFTEQKTATPWI
jgi:hypothetical protein